MNNLYIIFPDEQARRDFLLELMLLKVYDPSTDQTVWILPGIFKKHTIKPKPGELDQWFNPLEFGKMSSPYLDMKPLIGPDEAPDYIKKNRKPWHPFALVEKGLHRLYTLRSYRHRQGYWLVLRFFDTPIGRANYDWVVKRIPREQLGCHVQPSPIAPNKECVSWAAAVLDLPMGQKVDEKTCHDLFSCLQDVLATEPGLFTGKNVYLWENLAHRFFLNDDLKHCQQCCRIQADLQPHATDAYLNLGQYLSLSGHEEEAIAVYKQGLIIKPDDEFIYFNLASLLLGSNKSKKALKSINEAILSNPERGLNFWLKGRLHVDSGDYHAAVNSFRHSAQLMESEGNKNWNRVLLTTYVDLCQALKALDQPSEALAVLEKARQLDTADEHKLLQLRALILG